jgi:OFA family oxalate/formate antiporter-like MFS transporter
MSRLRFFYGWVIVACGGCASFARQGAAVATLSVFVTPMTTELDWSRAEMAGAVSLGGVLGAIISPMLGAYVDRVGARSVLLVSTVLVSLCALGLSGIEGLLGFYLFFSLARMAFAGPFDVAVTTAVANWFERYRARAMSYVSVAAALSLAIMPLLAQLAIDAGGWRAGWLTIAIAVLIVGAVPVALFMRRRPEDMGLHPDGLPPVSNDSAGAGAGAAPARDFSRHEATRTLSFWLLMFYTALAFCIQAGVSLHQAPYLVEKGIDPTTAATIVATFSLSAAGGALLFGRLGDRFPIRFILCVVALVLMVAAYGMTYVTDAAEGYAAAVVFGTGIGGLLTLPPVAFAAYFGRANYGAIRGLALTVQVTGQATGPLLAGIVHDVTGGYEIALLIFSGMGAVAAVVGLAARAPKALA